MLRVNWKTFNVPSPTEILTQPMWGKLLRVGKTAPHRLREYLSWGGDVESFPVNSQHSDNPRFPGSVRACGLRAALRFLNCACLDRTKKSEPWIFLPLIFKGLAPLLQSSPPTPMPSTPLPLLPTQRPPLSAHENPNVWEKVLQGVAMLAYGILRCVLSP